MDAVCDSVFESLGVLSNATRALEAMGVVGPVRAEALPIVTGQFCTDKGRVLKSVRMGEMLDPRYPSYVTHRADLLRWLLSALPAEVLHPGHLCTSIEPEADTPSRPGKVRLCFTRTSSTGSASSSAEKELEVEADIVIGADGFRSAVRTALWGTQKPRHSGQICYRGIAHYKLKEPGVLREIMGSGQRTLLSSRVTTTVRGANARRTGQNAGVRRG